MIPMSLEHIASALEATVSSQDRSTQVTRVVTDSRTVQPGDLFVALRGPRFDGHGFVDQAESRGAVACLCDRRWASQVADSGGAAVSSICPSILVDDTTEALGRLATYYRREIIPVGTVVIGVTGTNGKTTTKCMIDHVLSGFFPGRAAPKSFNNHIGVPLTLLSSCKDDRYLVVEIGASAAGEIPALSAMAQPDAAVITAIDQAHLEGFGGIEGVAREKSSLLEYVRSDGLAVVNIDHPVIRPYVKDALRCRLITVGTDPIAKLRVNDARGDMLGTQFELDGRFDVRLPMPGLHHATNAAATFAVARWFGVPPEGIIERLGTFESIEGRTRPLCVGGLTIIDDAYNANPGSMAAAIATLAQGSSRRRVFVMGDMLELGSQTDELHKETIRKILGAGIETLVTVGPISKQAVESMGDEPGEGRTISCDDVDSTLEVLMEILDPGDVVWIKGSRAVGLDRVVNGLALRWSKRVAVA